MIETFAQTVANNLKSKYGVTIPWELIIEAILSIIQNCPQNTPQTFVQAVRHPTIMQRVVMNLNIRKITGLSGHSKIVAVRDAVLEEAGKMSDEQLVSGYYQANSVFTDEYVVVDDTPVADGE